MNAPTVLILGARGRLGAAAVRAFSDAGWRVRAQARRPGAPWPAAVEELLLDALDSDAVCRAAQGVEVMINALNPLYTQWDTLARPLAASAAAAARASGALLIFPGNVYNFGRTLPAVLEHDTAQLGDTPKARIRIDIERQMVDLAALGVDSVVLRAGDYFGGQAKGTWFDLAIGASLHKGKLVYPGPADVPHAWAYLPDLAHTMVELARRRSQLHGAQCFHFAGHTLTGAALHAEVASLMGRPIRLASLPWGMIRLAAWLSPMARAMLEMRYLWQRPHQLDETPLRRLLGTVPHTPLAAALATTLRELDLSLAPGACA